MPKIVRDTYVTSMKGVNLFERYCLQHKPVIIFRETLKSDFGIDAELEMTEYTEDGKITPTGETMKVQIKTDGTGHSYIRNEKEDQFEFYALADDLEYWTKYKIHGFEVLLVIIDAINEKIYCRKVIDTDVGTVTIGLQRNKALPISFDKTSNRLDFEKNDFRTRFSETFRSRVTYGTTETIVSNLMKFEKHPRVMYAYLSKYSDTRSIRKAIQEGAGGLTFSNSPFFKAYGGILYSFQKLGSEYSLFNTEVLADNNPTKIIQYNQILDNVVLRNHFVELLNEYIREALRDRHISYQYRYKRYYFSFNPEKDSLPLTVEAKTKIRETIVQKKVVTWHEYGAKYRFYRHLAFNLHFDFIQGELYASLGHKYFFTEDGRKPLEPEQITKFTNFLTARDFNDKYYGWLHFWWTFLSKDRDTWDVFDYGGVSIKIQSFYSEDVGFGIPMENKIEKPKLRSRKKIKPNPSNNLLFEL